MLTVLAELCKTDSGLRMPLMPCCLSTSLCRYQSSRKHLNMAQYVLAHSSDVCSRACWQAEMCRSQIPAGAMMSSGVITVQNFRHLWLPFWLHIALRETFSVHIIVCSKGYRVCATSLACSGQCMRLPSDSALTDQAPQPWSRRIGQIHNPRTPKTMQALTFSEKEGLRLQSDYPKPEAAEGEALIKVIRAGICSTVRKCLSSSLPFGTLDHLLLAKLHSGGACNSMCSSQVHCQRT